MSSLFIVHTSSSVSQSSSFVWWGIEQTCALLLFASSLFTLCYSCEGEVFFSLGKLLSHGMGWAPSNKNDELSFLLHRFVCFCVVGYQEMSRALLGRVMKSERERRQLQLYKVAARWECRTREKTKFWTVTLVSYLNEYHGSFSPIIYPPYSFTVVTW